MGLNERIKILSAILLVVCLTLPISSCRRYVNSDGTKIVHYDPKTYPDAKIWIKYNYPLEYFKVRDIYDWLLLFCFMWPIPVILYRHRGKKRLIKKIIWIVEPLFVIVASGYIYLRASVFARPAIGAYLSLAANGMYGLLWLTELLMKIVRRHRHL